MRNHVNPILVLFVLVFTSAVVFADSSNQSPVSGTGVFPDTRLIAKFDSEDEIDEYVASCLRPSWQDIMRYPDDYIGKDIAVQGTSTQTERKGYFLNVTVAGKRNEPWWVVSWNQTMRPRGLFLTGDTIAVFGRLRATSQKDNDTLCPRIDARYIEVVSADHSIDDIIEKRSDSFHKSQAKQRAKSGGKAEFKWRTEKIDAGGLRIFLDKACLGTAFGEVVVPADIDGSPVRILGDGAFSGFDNITQVTLPDEVRAIGQKAFGGCTALVTLKMGNVHYIAGDAFDGCPSLTNVITPEGEYVRNSENTPETDGAETVSERLEKSPIQEILDNMIPIPGKSFALGKFEVTQKQWMAVMGDNPSHFKRENHPVEKVSWNDCQEFIKRLNKHFDPQKFGLTFRLPTNEEWEYACRAGATGPYCLLEDGTEVTKITLGEVAWFEGNSNKKTHPVGQKRPNAFGLYDMHGNVWEWTTGEILPTFRGGSWCYSDEGCEISSKKAPLGSCCTYDLGFRLCLSGKAD